MYISWFRTWWNHFLQRHQLNAASSIRAWLDWRDVSLLLSYLDCSSLFWKWYYYQCAVVSVYCDNICFHMWYICTGLYVLYFLYFEAYIIIHPVDYGVFMRRTQTTDTVYCLVWNRSLKYLFVESSTLHRMRDTIWIGFTLSLDVYSQRRHKSPVDSNDANVVRVGEMNLNSQVFYAVLARTRDIVVRRLLTYIILQRNPMDLSGNQVFFSCWYELDYVALPKEDTQFEETKNLNSRF